MTVVKPADIPQLYKKALTAQNAGRAGEAMAIYRDILKTQPRIPEVLFQVARIQAAAGNRDQAEAALRSALRAKPDEPDIWRALAQILSGSKLAKLEREAKAAGISLSGEPDITPVQALIKSGQFKEAETLAFKLVKQAPNAAKPAYALASARAAQGNWKGVVGPAEKAVERDPKNASAKAMLGEALMMDGHMHRALPVLEEVVGETLLYTPLLARAYTQTARFEDAEALLNKAIAKAPEGSGLHIELSDVLVVLGRVPEARKSMARAIKLDQGKTAIALLVRLADKCDVEGFTAAALEVIDEALTLDPGNPGLLTKKGYYLQSAGDLDGALATINEARRLHPDSPVPLKSYSSMVKFTPDDPVIEQLDRHLSGHAIEADARRALNFAMGKALIDTGAHDRAFGYLNVGNRLTHDKFPYDFQKDLDRARTYIRSWREVLSDMAPETPADHVIFVSGPPRSGTTLVETILTAHPRVSAGGELAYLRQALFAVFGQFEDGESVQEADLALAGERYLVAARRRARADDIFTDKSIATSSTVGHAARALPGARFLLMQRDLRDVGFSIYRNMFVDGRHRYGTDLFELGRYLRLSQMLQDFWVEALPDKVHLVDYAALTDAPEPHIRALVAAAGLDWDDACLEPHKVERQVKTLSVGQVRQPIYKSSVAGWKRYEAELGPMLEGLDAKIDLD